MASLSTSDTFFKSVFPLKLRRAKLILPKPQRIFACSLCGSPQSRSLTKHSSTTQKQALNIADNGKKWQSVIGLEIHAQIKSASKLFSGAGTQFGVSPNTQVSLFDAAFPGTLPAWEQGRQEGGMESKTVDKGLSRGDGVGLMEIVTAPDFTCGDDAASFVKDLRDVLVTLGTCDGRMAEGSMRVDANVSVHLPGDPWGTRTEVKNLNSTRNVRLAIDYEIERQIEILENAGVIENETRSFDAEDGQTVAMRDKEKLLDYRFLPEPNLPPLVIHLDRSTLPSESSSLFVTLEEDGSGIDKICLPDQQREILEKDYEVPLIHSVVLVRHGLYDLFVTLVTHHNCDTRAASAILKTSYVAFLDDQKVEASNSPVSTQELAELIHIYHRGEISSSSLSIVLGELSIKQHLSCQAIIEEKGLWMVSNEEVIHAAIDEVLAKNPQNVKSYKKGKVNQLKVFTNKVIKILEGKANASHVQSLIKEKLDK
ncbi:glutamyl-tRNA(Gln) amidotransferase subunit B, mitochondrial [Elysia marginata]|uniref:Glutamyl-tRNA(Gln) amidotransferase subunit B, mitochondrial n=1 Tax=Elysia marginata TaxID=1093978 RepID=A0AAV4FBG4_9GAST|nr:glutamyl-tRNA(Gln) amidotransferase subunit B, mitochondrial [Elysia marginata]